MVISNSAKHILLHFISDLLGLFGSWLCIITEHPFLALLYGIWACIVGMNVGLPMFWALGLKRLDNFYNQFLKEDSCCAN